MMKEVINETDRLSSVSELVRSNYRLADVFRKHGIDFCCGGNRPLAAICEAKGIDLNTVAGDIHHVRQTAQFPGSQNAEKWPIEFLTDYIVQVHHEYIKTAIPLAIEYLTRFVEGHKRKYPFLPELLGVFTKMGNQIDAHIKEEEEIIFPYIRQIASAHFQNAPYASLLVRTLRKPVEKMMGPEHHFVTSCLKEIRQLTDNYQPPPSACITHVVSFYKLNEIDSDLQMHLHLENKILFPKAIQMEKELLARGS